MNYSVKMRAEKESRHVSGAERIVHEDELEVAASALIKRARTHVSGAADFISIKISKIHRPVQTIPALKVTQPETKNTEETKALLLSELNSLGLQGEKILDLFYSIENMRGAILLDMNTLERLEPDAERGVRVTTMDYEGNDGAQKNHFKEALCLASKAASCEYIAAELCASDDPDYTIGYFASKTRGYVRLTNIKKAGLRRGGRVFLFSGKKENISQCIDFLENQPVMVRFE